MENDYQPHERKVTKFTARTFKATTPPKLHMGGSGSIEVYAILMSSWLFRRLIMVEGVTEEGIQKKDGHQKGGVCVVVFRVELKCWWEPNVERSTWIKHTTYYVVPDIEWRRQKVRKAQKNAQLPMIRYPRIITYSSPRLDTASDPKGPGALRWNRNTRCTPSTAAQRYEIKDQRTWSEYQHRKFS